MRKIAAVAIAPIALLGALSACNDTAPAEGEETAQAAAAVPETATLDLQASGIVVPAQNGFEELSVPFGSNRAATETTLAGVLGAETGRSDGTGDCWLASTSYQGMTLNFTDDKLVGYFANAPYVPELTRAEMVANPDVQLVEDSTLGDEFFIGDPQVSGIAGLFDGAGDNAAVQALWAGENCIFR